MFTKSATAEDSVASVRHCANTTEGSGFNCIILVYLIAPVSMAIWCGLPQSRLSMKISWKKSVIRHMAPWCILPLVAGT